MRLSRVRGTRLAAAEQPYDLMAVYLGGTDVVAAVCTGAKRVTAVEMNPLIVDAVRGEDYAVTERAVDVQIVGLRKKLGSCGDYIETVRGVGYRFKE